MAKSTVVRELITILGVKAEDKDIEKFEQGINSLKFGLAGLIGSVGAVSAALFGIVKVTADAAEETKLLAMQAGVGAEEFQRLAFAAKLSNISADELALGMRFLNRNLDEARRGGSENVKAFQRLGFATKDIRSGTITTQAALARLADTFQKLPDGPQKTSLAMDLMGRSAGRMIPLLSQGSAEMARMGDIAQKLGGVMSGEQIEAFDHFNDTLDILMLGVKSIGKAIAIELLPTVQLIVDQINEWLMANSKLIKQDLKGFVKGLVGFVKMGFSMIMALTESVLGLSRAFGGVGAMTKAALMAFAILSGGAILYGIGALAMGAWSLAGALTTASVMALAIPLAIGAAIAAVGLLIEDFVAFSQGRDSVFGMLINGITSLGKMMGDKLQSILGSVATFVVDMFKPIIDFLNMVTTKVAGITSATSGKINSVLEVVGLYKPSQRATTDNAPLPGSVTSSNTGGSVTVSAPITVMVPAGTPPGEVGNRVESGVQRGIGGLLRGAGRATAPGVSY